MYRKLYALPILLGMVLPAISSASLLESYRAELRRHYNVEIQLGPLEQNRCAGIDRYCVQVQAHPLFRIRSYPSKGQTPLTAKEIDFAKRQARGWFLRRHTFMTQTYAVWGLSRVFKYRASARALRPGYRYAGGVLLGLGMILIGWGAGFRREQRSS